jgi:hypothetical protein
MRQNFPDFATVLKEAEAGGDSDEQTHRPHIGLASAVFSAGFSPIASSGPATQTTFPSFDTNEVDDEAENVKRDLVERMKNHSPASIRSELDLKPGMKRAELQRLRRSFAASNHPDRLPEEFRLAAEQRMKTANALLDSAMASATNEL